jgi:hypothetical protein
MASVQLTYNQIKDRVQQRSPGASNLGIDGLAAELQVPSIQIAQPDPIFIEIDAFRPQDGFTSEARTDIELQELLGINTNTQENTYAGKQILINSGRIILNSYDDYLMLFSSDGIAVSSKGTFNVDTDEEITLFGDQGLFLGVPNKGLPYTTPKPPQALNPPQDLGVPAGDNLPVLPQEGSGAANDPVKINVNNTAESPLSPTQRDLAKAELSVLGDERNVATTDRDYDPLILGNKLADWLSDLILTIQTLQINTPAGPGYVSAGDSQYNLKKLNARIPEMISTYAYIDGRSHLKVDDPGPPPPPDANDNLSGNIATTLSDQSAVAATPQPPPPIGTIPQYTLQQLQTRASQLGYGPLNRVFALVGIRSGADAYDQFDDMFIVINNGELSYFKSTTNPGGSILSGGFKEFNTTGAAVLVPGQYEVHSIGKHQGKYDAGTQRGSVAVNRDNNLNKKAGDGVAAQSGLFGINIHRASATGTTTRVNGYSAGCQVWATAGDFNAFIQNWRNSKIQKLQYTLFTQF